MNVPDMQVHHLYQSHQYNELAAAPSQLSTNCCIKVSVIIDILTAKRGNTRRGKDEATKYGWWQSFRRLSLISR